MSADWNRGMLRVCLLLAALWVAGMGWYQYAQARQDADNSVTIAISKDTSFHIDASGIKQEDKNSVQMKRLAWVFLPALAILLIVPVSGWLRRGFKPEGQS